MNNKETERVYIVTCDDAIEGVFTSFFLASDYIAELIEKYHLSIESFSIKDEPLISDLKEIL